MSLLFVFWGFFTDLQAPGRGAEDLLQQMLYAATSFCSPASISRAGSVLLQGSH